MINLLTAVTLAIVALRYALGLPRVWRKSIRAWQAVAFFAGCASVWASLLSRIDAWSDVFFSAHMGQHEILMLVSAPLMVLGRPFLVTLHALPAPARAAIANGVRLSAKTWERLTGPLTVLLLHAIVLWAWHVPVAFEAALHHDALHAVQHLMFFLTAALFWWALIHGRYGRAGYGIGVLYVFATAMHTQLLGALLTFGHRTWYPTHAMRTAASGVNPVDDQQLAGVVMWIPFGVVFLLSGLALFAAWLGEAERRVAFTSAARAARKSSIVMMIVLLFLGCHRADERTARELTAGDPARGHDAILQYGCGACHHIPGVSGASGQIAPPLDNIGNRVMLAGQLPNTPANMMRWIRDPQGVVRGTAMPNMNVSDADARDIAAYLYTLRQ